MFQIVGWSLFAVSSFFLAVSFSPSNTLTDNVIERGILRLLFFVELGIICTHVLRELVRSTYLLMKTMKVQLITFSVLILVFSNLVAGGFTLFEFTFLNVKEYTYPQLYYINFGRSLPVIVIWAFIYFMYHFIAKTRKQQMDTIKLEALVKSLELKTIKAHINPHFIFNALNSIRALIDENPQRARKAITELSNILRSSLKTEKGETVSLEDELKIVKDYLALENMRFEDRLKIEYEVDDDTLDQQVPPMMLQTLVENAIKHGISKQVKGGMVRIISDFKSNFHELAVQNTGHLNGKSNTTGFGLSSTQDRLQLLYGEKAKFEIKQVDPDLVEAKVLIPISLN